MFSYFSLRYPYSFHSSNVYKLWFTVYTPKKLLYNFNLLSFRRSSTPKPVYQPFQLDPDSTIMYLKGNSWTKRDKVVLVLFFGILLWRSLLDDCPSKTRTSKSRSRHDLSRTPQRHGPPTWCQSQEVSGSWTTKWLLVFVYFPLTKRLSKFPQLNKTY